MKQETLAVQDFVEFSKFYIKNHETSEDDQLKKLDEITKHFEDHSIEKTILNWYTSDCFFYRMVNNTLRDNNMINIFKIRVAIFYLDQNLQNMGKIVINYPKHLYKGSKIEKHEFEFWQSNHTPIFLKEFVSTSEDKEMAKTFIKRNSPECYPILFRIDVDEAFKQKIIDIQQFSDFAAEKEFLISINTFLMVKDINKISKADGKLDYYEIVANFSDFKKIEVNNITKTYMDNIEEIFKKNYPNEIFYLAEYFKQNSHYPAIQDLFKDLNPENLDNESKALYYSYLGYSYMYNFELSSIAEQHFQKEKELLGNLHRTKDIEFGICESNIGELYFYQEKIEESKIQFEKALAIGKSFKEKELKFVADCLQKIGETLQITKDFELAEIYFLESNRIFSNKFQNCPAYADNLGKVGHILFQLGDFDKSCEYFVQASHIAEKTIGKINIQYFDIIIRYSICLSHKKQFKTAYEMLASLIKKAENEKSFLGNLEVIRSSLYSRAGYCLMRMDQYEKAKECLKIAMELNIALKFKFNIARTGKKIGILYYLLKDYEKALSYFNEALEIFEERKSEKEIVCLKQILVLTHKTVSEKKPFDIIEFIDTKDTTEI